MEIVYTRHVVHGNDTVCVNFFHVTCPLCHNFPFKKRDNQNLLKRGSIVSIEIKKNRMTDYILVIFGSFLMALSVNTFAIPNHLGEGGIPGLTMILYYLFKWPTSFTSFSFNGFLLLIGLKVLDKETIVKTVVSIFANSLFLHLLEPYPFTFQDSFLAPLAAGGVMGVGIGLIYLGQGTAAGGTIIARMLEVTWHLPKSKGILITDLAVILPSVFIIGFEKWLLTIISVYFGSRMIALVSEGVDPKKSVMIISPKVHEISDVLAKEIKRNGTFVKGIGSYSNQEQEVLYLVIAGTEIISVKKKIQEIDPEAFIVVTDVNDVSGKRFMA